MELGKDKTNKGEGGVGFVSLHATEGRPWHEGPTCQQISYLSLYVVGCLALITLRHDSFHHFKWVSR